MLGFEIKEGLGIEWGWIRCLKLFFCLKLKLSMIGVFMRVVSANYEKVSPELTFRS